MEDYPYDERIPGETRLAFQYFELYLNQTGNRSIRDLCVRIVGRKKRSLTVISRWSSACHWQDRVKAFDRDQQKERAKAARKIRKGDIEKFVRTENSINERSQAFVMLVMDDLFQKGQTDRNVAQYRMVAMGHSAMREHSKEILGFLDENADRESEP